MKKLLFLSLLPLSVFAQKQNEIKIKAKLPAEKAIDRIIVIYRVDDNITRDTILNPGTEFKYKTEIAEPVLGYVTFESKTPLRKVGSSELKYYQMPVFLAGDMEIQIADSIQNSKLTGSKWHDQYLALLEAKKPLDEMLRSMNAPYQQAAKENNQAEMARLMKFYDSVNALINTSVYIPFIEKNPGSPVALYAVKEAAGYSIDPSKTEPLFARLSPALQNSIGGKIFKEKIDIAKKTAVGEYAMDFTQNDTLDRPISLSSFRGKYVLVDFWASWCGPCRKENPNIVKVFNTYKDRNFTVLGVSLDRSNAKDKWLKAIHDDQLTWTHVSDLKYWDNAVAKQYGIQAIPQNLLLDPQGKIIAKNVKGDDLEKELEKYLAR